MKREPSPAYRSRMASNMPLTPDAWNARFSTKLRKAHSLRDLAISELAKEMPLHEITPVKIEAKELVIKGMLFFERQQAVMISTEQCRLAVNCCKPDRHAPPCARWGAV